MSRVYSVGVTRAIGGGSQRLPLQDPLITQALDKKEKSGKFVDPVLSQTGILPFSR